LSARHLTPIDRTHNVDRVRARLERSWRAVARSLELLQETCPARPAVGAAAPGADGGNPWLALLESEAAAIALRDWPSPADEPELAAA
jgi:hypothetical protein